LDILTPRKKTPDPSGSTELPRPGVAVVNSIPKQPPTLGQAAGQDKFNKSIECPFTGRYKQVFTKVFAGAD